MNQSNFSNVADSTPGTARLNLLKTALVMLFITLAIKGSAQQGLIAKTSQSGKPALSAAVVSEKQAYAITPAAVKNSARIVVEAERDAWATIQVLSDSGEILLEQQMAVSKGANSVPLFYVSQLDKGIYKTILRIEDKEYHSSLVKE